jgi:ectoine hydroxylase-related dioxygenase (phytanoyl-CoA dioxygenase family)
MLFLNPPGLGGQGWHQDAYYIPTFPDTLIGAWLTLDQADEENGCLWVIPGSHAEPIYRPPNASAGPPICPSPNRSSGRRSTWRPPRRQVCRRG